MKRVPVSCFIVIIGLLLLSNTAVYGCSCMGTEKPSTEFRKTPVIFVGTAKNISSADSRQFGDEYNRNNLKTSFFVNERIKGVKAGHIDIYTSNQGTACGISFAGGEKYLVYAYDSGEEKKYLSTNTCTRTRSAEGKDDEIAVLRSLAKGKLEPRIYGRIEEIVRGIFLLDNKENIPMSGIKITARSDRNFYETVTDSDGRFSFKNIGTGIYALEVKLPATHKLGDDSWGFKEKQAVDLSYTVTDRDSPDFITVETRVDGRIKGKIFDNQGNPAGKNVRVSLVTKDTVNNADDKIQYISAETNKDGIYEFEGIPPGDYYLGINLDLSQPYKDNPYPKSFYPNGTRSENASLIKLSYGQKLSGLNLTLPPPLKKIIVKGKVKRRDGTPAAGVEVYVTNQARHDFEDFVWLKTDANGEFTATCLEGLTYRFAVYGKNYSIPNSEIIKAIDPKTDNYIELSAEN